MWEVKHRIDIDYNDGTSSKWWDVRKDDIEYRSENESHAKKLAAILNSIEKNSERDCRYDNPEFQADSHSGGNFDDAYEMGVEDGEIQAARSLMILFEVIR